MTMEPEALSLNHVKTLSTKEIISKPTRFLEDCLIIWLNDDTSNKYEIEQEELRKVVYGLKTFNNIDGCISFISNIQDEKVFLIISTNCHSIERFQYLSHLEKIYIFASNPNQLNDLKQRKLNYDIFETIDALYQKLHEDIKLCVMDLIPITVVPLPSEEYSLSSILTQQEAAFLFSQMLKEIIYRLKFDSGSKDVFIEFCRMHYNSEQLLLIEEFAKNYRPNKALTFLTKRCFVSQILSRVLRTREIDVIYKLGFLIKQLHIQLNRLHEENALVMKNISTVYRGKTMSTEDFDLLLKDKSGCLLSFRSFLITTITKEISIDFITRRLATHLDMIGVLFEIHIDHNKFSEKTPFALLKDTDMNNDEICFHLSTIFYIESIEQAIIDVMVIWIVKLKLVNDDDQRLRHLLKFSQSDEVHANPVSYLGRMLINMGEYRRAEQVFLSLLQDTSVLSQPRRLVRTHNGLGGIYTFKKEYGKALHHYQQALQNSLLYLQSDHLDLVPIYKAIGDTYLNQSEYKHAIENYEKVIELLKNETQHVYSELLTDLHTRMHKAKEAIERN